LKNRKSKAAITATVFEKHFVPELEKKGEAVKNVESSNGFRFRWVMNTRLIEHSTSTTHQAE